MSELSRDEIASIHDAANRAQRAVEQLPYAEARKAITALDEIREIAGEHLPGGYYGPCIGCDELKGQDEMVGCGDEDLCADCCDRHAASIAGPKPAINEGPTPSRPTAGEG